MKRAAFILFLISSLVLVSVVQLLAQGTARNATPEATPEATSITSEATPEVTDEAASTISEIFASLPQSRLDDGGFVVGSLDAPITIIEFIDYACPHCQAYRPTIDQVITDYVATGQARLELRIFPTAGGQLTYFVGQLVECAENQQAGAFWQSYELLYNYATSGRYTQDVGGLLADDLDLNYDDLLTCAADAHQIETDIALGQELGVSGTPGVRARYWGGAAKVITVNGMEYPAGGVPLDVLAYVIDQANGTGTGTSAGEGEPI